MVTHAINVENATVSEDAKIETVKRAIIETLTYYGPTLSRTMISSHVSPIAYRYNLAWTPIFQQLVLDGVIAETIMLNRVNQRVPVYRLASREDIIKREYKAWG